MTEIMKFTILIDNTPADDIRLSHEHGLSIYFETDGHRYLLDTGLSGKALENAVTMGLDLTKIDALILSHGHIDHTGGLERFLQANHDAPIYASEKIATSDYQSDHHGKRHSLSPNQELIARNVERFHLLKEDNSLSEHIWLVFNKHQDFACPKGNSFQTIDGQPYKSDDEIAIAIEEDGRLHILASCSHAGMLNIIRSCQEATGIDDVASYTGGLHLLDDCDDDVDALCDHLQQIAPAMNLYTGHCTGSRAIEKLQERLQDRFHLFRTGETYYVK